MVRGNWQKRVETAEARRRETKQRKIKSDEKRLYKLWVQDLWHALDQYEAVIRKQRKSATLIHVWSDSLPLSSPTILDLFSEPGAVVTGSSSSNPKILKRGVGGRPRSVSFESEGSTGEGGGGAKGRPRGGSFGSASQKKVHPRSKEAHNNNNNVDANSGTDLSQSNLFQSKNDDSYFLHNLLLCQRQFLNGKFDGGGGGGTSKKVGAGVVSCRFVHYSAANKQYLSLADVLQKDNNDWLEAQKRVEVALQSYSLSHVDMNGAMDMLYYSVVQVGPADEVLTTTKDGDGENLDTNAVSATSPSTATSLSDDIANQLARSQTLPASVVYVAVDGRLVFDRNQEGGILSGVLENLFGFHPRTTRSRQNSLSSDDSEEPANVQPLPGTVLEHILLFLPDSAVAMCCQVCRAWNNEIGQARSPFLWLCLLNRSNWSPPPRLEAPGTTAATTTNDADGGGGETAATTTPAATARPDPQQQIDEYAVQCRALFKSHYTVLREIRGLASAVSSILSTSSNPLLIPHHHFYPRQSAARAATIPVLNEKEVACQCFLSRKNTPHESDVCVSLQQWSPNYILAAYGKDCTLRLFQATSSSTWSSSSSSSSLRLGCRELICFSVDPYKSTKKRTCTLDAVGLDETTIGCLCHVTAPHLQQQRQERGGGGHPPAAFVLVVLSRDNFLLGEGEGEGLQVIDVGEAVLNFVLSSDEVDHRLLPLFDYLSDYPGHLGHIHTVVSRNCIASCGYGRFMVEVSISIPNDGLDDDEEGYGVGTPPEVMIQLDRKLVLFSAHTHAIVWMGDSYPTPQIPPAATIPALVSSCRQRPYLAGARTACAIATASVVSPPSLLLSCSIERSGQVQVPQILEHSDVIRHSLLSEGFQSIPTQCLLVCPSDIVVAETINRVNEEEDEDTRAPQDFQSSFVFFPQSPNLEESETAHSPTHSVLHLEGNVRVHMMVSLRDEYIVALCTESFSHPSDMGARENIAGQWFAPRELEASLSNCLHTIVVVHIPVREEIGRIPFARNVDYDSIRPRISAQSRDTIALAIAGLGISITGHDVRHLVDPIFVGHLDLPGDQDVDGKHHKQHQQQPKKKPPRTKKNSKKDGFARGMSLRG